MVLLDLITELLDVACWHPLTHGLSRRFLKTGYMLSQQQLLVLEIRPCSLHVLQELLSFLIRNEPLLHRLRSFHLHLMESLLALLHNGLLHLLLSNQSYLLLYEFSSLHDGMEFQQIHIY